MKYSKINITMITSCQRITCNIRSWYTKCPVFLFFKMQDWVQTLVISQHKSKSMCHHKLHYQGCHPHRIIQVNMSTYISRRTAPCRGRHTQSWLAYCKFSCVRGYINVYSANKMNRTYFLPGTITSTRQWEVQLHIQETYIIITFTFV